MGEVVHLRPADRRVLVPESDPGEFAEAINDPARPWAASRHRRTSRAGLVADVVDIRTRRPVRDVEAVLVKLGHPMSELEVVLARFGAAIAERERQQQAAREKPE